MDLFSRRNILERSFWGWIAVDWSGDSLKAIPLSVDWSSPLVDRFIVSSKRNVDLVFMKVPSREMLFVLNVVVDQVV